MTSALNGWQRRPLQSITESIDYGHTASATNVSCGPRFLRITDIQNGKVRWSSVPYCDATEAEVTKYSLRPGDIVFARTGNTTGKSYLIRECPETAVFASYLIRVRPRNDIDPRYLAYFFNSSDYWQQIEQRAEGAGQPGVNATKLKQLEIPLPNLPEQKRIASILDKADAIRRNRETALHVLESLTAAVYFARFGHPASAASARPLSECVDFLSGGTPSKRNGKYWGGQFPWVSPKDMKVDYIADAEDHVTNVAFDETTLKAIPAKSILVVIRGMILIHSVPVALTDVPVAINQDMKALLPKKGYLPEFIFWTLKCARNYLLSKVATAAHGTKRIEMEHLAGVPVPKASSPEQEKFVAVARRIRLAIKRSRSFESHELFDSLVQRAFRGEL